MSLIVCIICRIYWAAALSNSLEISRGCCFRPVACIRCSSYTLEAMATCSRKKDLIAAKIFSIICENACLKMRILTCAFFNESSNNLQFRESYRQISRLELSLIRNSNFQTTLSKLSNCCHLGKKTTLANVLSAAPLKQKNAEKQHSNSCK